MITDLDGVLSSGPSNTPSPSPSLWSLYSCIKVYLSTARRSTRNSPTAFLLIRTLALLTKIEESFRPSNISWPIHLSHVFYSSNDNHRRPLKAFGDPICVFEFCLADAFRSGSGTCHNFGNPISSQADQFLQCCSSKRQDSNRREYSDTALRPLPSLVTQLSDRP